MKVICLQISSYKTIFPAQNQTLCFSINNNPLQRDKTAVIVYT